jgi:hypothetical protein
VTAALHPLGSDVVKACLPRGQAKPFPLNGLSLMTVTGAKGSGVNFSQISALLGQQARAATVQLDKIKESPRSVRCQASRRALRPQSLRISNRAPDIRAAGPAGARCDPTA